MGGAICRICDSHVMEVKEVSHIGQEKFDDLHDIQFAVVDWYLALFYISKAKFHKRHHETHCASEATK